LTGAEQVGGTVGRLANAWTSAHAGRAEEGLQALDRVLAVSEDASTGALTVDLETAVLLGHVEGARRLVERLGPVSGHIAGWQVLTAIGRHLGAASLLLGRPDEARAYYQQALEVCQRARFRPEIALTRLQMAELLLEHYPDERTGALEHLEFAIAEFREMKMQPSLERALKHKGLLGA